MVRVNQLQILSFNQSLQFSSLNGKNPFYDSIYCDDCMLIQ